jgi:hypothetical protein
LFKNTCKTVYSLREHLAVVSRRSRRLVYYCVQRAATIYDSILVFCIFPAKQYFSEWAMLGSNQRPLPCEGRSITSWLFAGVQKYLQINGFLSGKLRVCSPLFVWVGVLLVYMSLTATPALSHLCVVSSPLRYARRGMRRPTSPHGCKDNPGHDLNCSRGVRFH